MNIKIDLSVQMTPDKNKLSPSYLCYSKDEVSQAPLIFPCDDEPIVYQDWAISRKVVGINYTSWNIISKTAVRYQTLIGIDLVGSA